MPKLITDADLETGSIPGLPGFHFSGARPEDLGATEYTLVTIAVDVTGSVRSFAGELLRCLQAAVTACKRSPRAENLLLRVITFNTAISEIHGFKPLAEIEPATDYKPLNPTGLTAVYDATYSAVGATLAYGAKLADQFFTCNGIVFVITDGDDTSSKATPAMIRRQVDDATVGEKLESLVTVLVGINAQQTAQRLAAFKDGAGLTQFVDAGEATERKLAKLAEFVSTSISSASQALGTGGPSQALTGPALTI